MRVPISQSVMIYAGSNTAQAAVGSAMSNSIDMTCLHCETVVRVVTVGFAVSPGKASFRFAIADREYYELPDLGAMRFEYMKRHRDQFVIP